MAYIIPAFGVVDFDFGARSWSSPASIPYSAPVYTAIDFELVVSLTASVSPGGFDTSAFGTGLVHFPGVLLPTGINTLSIGTAFISMRIRTLLPTGWDSLGVGKPSTHTNKVYPVGTDFSNFGTLKIATNVVNTLGATFDAYGTAFIAQAVRTLIPTSITPLTFGTQKVFTNKIQGIGFSTMHVADSGAEPHPGTFISQRQRYILYAGGFNSLVFGLATRRDNILRPTGIPKPDVGSPAIVHFGLYAKPSGISTLAFGQAAITNNSVPAGCGDQLTIGKPGVWPYHLRPTGFSTLLFGTTHIQRNELAPHGLPPVNPDLYWYDPVHNISVNTQLGFPTVTNSMQFCNPEGFDMAVVMSGDGPAHDDIPRSGVRHAAAPLQPIGIASTTQWGTARISKLQQVIAPGGINSLIFGQTGRRLRNDVSPSGFDSMEFGDVQQWEAGTVKPYGADMAHFGVGRIKYVISVPSIQSLALGTPSIASRISPSSIAPSTFVGPAASNEMPCHKFLVVFPTVGSTAAFGNPGVST